MAVIPSGTSEPWFWAARESAANDALARLFYSLIAKREDRESARQQREDLFERQKAFQDATLTRQQAFTAGQNELYRTPASATATQGPSLLSGTGPATRAPAPAAPAPAAPTVGPGTRSFAPSGNFGPPTGKFSQNDVNQQIAMTNNDDTDGDGAVLPTNGRPTGYTTELSADTVKTPKNKPVTPKYTPGQVARPPRKSRYVDQTYGDIDPPISEAWANAEKKYGLPQGVLQTVMGLTHNGGRTLGPDGWFGLNADLRRTFSIPDSAINDPIAMGNYAAQNLQRNMASYNAMAKGLNIPQLTGKSAAEIPMLALLMRTGPKDGPRIIAQLHTNDAAPLHATLAPTTGADPARRVVSEFGLPSDATVGDLYHKMREQIKPYAERMIIDQDREPKSQVNDDANAPIPPKGVGAGDAYEYLISRGLTPQGAYTLRRPFAEKMAAFLQRGEAATGAKVSLNNGYRTPEEQAQIRADAKGVNVYWNNQKYTPNPNSGRRGIKAAGPGKSNHQDGTAMDVNRGPVRDWMRRNVSGTGIRTISGDDPHFELDIPKRIGMARPRDTHPDTGAPSTATATASPSATQQPAATAAAAPPSATAAASTPQAPTPAETGAVGFFNTDKTDPTGAIRTAGTFNDPYNEAPTGVAQRRTVPDSQARTATAPTQMPDDSAASANVPVPQTAPAATPQAPTATPITPPRTVPDMNRQATLDDRGAAPTTLSAPDRQAALDERGLPPASVGPMGLVSEPRPDPQQDDIIARRTADANAPQPDQQRYLPINVRKLLDRLTGDDQQLPSSQGVDEAGMTDFGTSQIQNQPGTGVNDIIAWIKDKAAQYNPGLLNTQQVAPDAAANAPDTRGKYDPGFLDPAKRKELEDAIMNRRVANPPPDTQGGVGANFSYSPGMLDPSKIEDERIRLNERPVVDNPPQAGPASNLANAIFGGATAASADTPVMPDDAQVEGTPDNVAAADSTSDSASGPGMESVPDDRGEVDRANQQQPNLQMPQMVRPTQEPMPQAPPMVPAGDAAQAQAQPSPEMTKPIEGDRSGLGALLKAFGGGGIDLSPKPGDDEKFALMNTLLNYFKGAPKETHPIKTIPIRPQAPTTLPSGEPLIVTDPNYRPIPKPTAGPAPTAIPGGLLQGGTMPPPPGGGKYKIDPNTGKVVLQ